MALETKDWTLILMTKVYGIVERNVRWRMDEEACVITKWKRRRRAKE
jgi:hypothetical protein